MCLEPFDDESFDASFLICGVDTQDCGILVDKLSEVFCEVSLSRCHSTGLKGVTFNPLVSFDGS